MTTPQRIEILGVPVDAVGLCGAAGGEMATTTVSKACDQFRPRGSRGGG